MPSFVRVTDVLPNFTKFETLNNLTNLAPMTVYSVIPSDREIYFIIRDPLVPHYVNLARLIAAGTYNAAADYYFAHFEYFDISRWPILITSATPVYSD